MRETDTANTETIFRIIQSIPSPKAEPFKQWLAKVGYERVQETKEIIAARLSAPHYEIGNLGECSGKIWKEMARLGMYSPFPSDGEVRLFMERVRDGINHALSLPGPSLIVAHGGVHWAACCLMSIENHEWAVSNCAVVHFSIGNQGKWIASRLS